MGSSVTGLSEVSDNGVRWTRAEWGRVRRG